MCRCFNPRSGLATGATRCQNGSASDGIVSIRAPVLRPERPLAGQLMDAIAKVSIRAPVLRPERLARRRTLNRRSWLFQSALRSCDRSDAWTEMPPLRMTAFQSALRSCDRSDFGHGREHGLVVLFQSALRSCDPSDGVSYLR